MAATEVVGFIAVMENGAMVLRSKEQLAYMMMRGFDPTQTPGVLFRGIVKRGDFALAMMDEAQRYADDIRYGKE